ncbi:MAG: glutamate-cysteine ligase family protein [Solirubrobacterales bacterium]|nr:glutamate-cysteine ligase family protein [Solirubrobacterales bacterium]
MTLDLTSAADAFEGSEDFTVGLEEEFALLDPETLSMVARYEDLRQAAEADPLLGPSVAGELIASEIEIRSGRGKDLSEAISLQREYRRRLFSVAESLGLSLGSTGTHPWSDYRDQQIIDTEHYQRVQDSLRYVAWRAIAVCDRLRPVLPLLLAISANSPFLDGRDSGLQSARTQTFTKSFPRCGVPAALQTCASFADYVEFLVKTNSIVEFTQVWWSVRPHISFGTVEVRICDAQSTAAESEALAALVVACVAQASRDYDEGRPAPPLLGGGADLSGSLIEENMWRAIRYGLSGKMIDFGSGQEFACAHLVGRLLDWTAPMRGELGITPSFPELNGAGRQRAMIEAGLSMQEIYSSVVAETRTSYSQEMTL